MNIYGLSEVIGPGVSCETADRVGAVIMEDHFVPEIVEGGKLSRTVDNRLLQPAIGRSGALNDHVGGNEYGHNDKAGQDPPDR